jgi:hypothetical protein
MLRNPSHEPERRILSYIKYLLRCAGILYHHVPDVHPATLQLVLPLGPAPDDPPLSRPTPAPEPARDWVSSLLGLGTKKSAVARSASVPAPKARGPTPPPSPAPRGKKAWSQAVYLRIDVERVSSASRAPSRAPSRTPSAAPSRPGSRAPSRTGSRASSATRISRKSSSSTSHSDAEAQLVPVTEGIVQNLTLNSLTLETGMTPLPFPLTDIVTPAMPAAPKLHRPQLPGSGFPPSPLGRVASPTSSSPPSPHPQARRSVSSHTHTPRVTLTLSEPRGYPLLRSALAAAVSGSRASVDEGPPLSPLTRALAIPSSGSSGAGSGAASEDDEERGRPRSKDTPPERDARSATVRPSSGSGSGTPGGTLGATPRPRRRRREASGTPAGAADGGESDSPPTSPISPPLPRGVTRLPRPHPRHERKPSGLLEAIFGKAEGPGAPRRAASVPPPRGSTPPPDALPAN